MADTDVLIVGAGPTGLVLALWLHRLGVRVRIIDKTAEPGTTSRALAVQARTLELYAQLGLAESVVERGLRMAAVNLWAPGKKVARAAFAGMGEGISPFPYVLIFEQDAHERLLVDRLAEAGVDVERRCELVDFSEADGRVHARVKHADGSVEECSAQYIAGCDGAHSTVRESLGIAFPGGTYAHLFYVADVEASGAALDGEVHVALDTTDFLAVFPLKQPGRARLIGTVLDDGAPDRDHLAWPDVSKRVIEWMHVDVAQVHWFSTYRVHHRVADRFRSGRAFLVGDAAHIHSPVGGQGMNTGIGDAVNLAWKLAAVVQRRADPSLLDSYEPERAAFAHRLVSTTDRAFTGVTSAKPLARLLRLHVFPPLVRLLFGFPAVRRFMFRTVSQTSVNYRRSFLSDGRVRRIRGGDRLPWVADATGSDNFAPLKSLGWQVHVYGEAGPEAQTTCDSRQVPLHLFPWRLEMERQGLQRDAIYLVRPDGYVAVAAPAGRITHIARYLDAHRPRPPADQDPVPAAMP